MRRLILALALGLTLIACAAPPASVAPATPAPATPTTSAAPSVEPSVAPSAEPSAAASADVPFPTGETVSFAMGEEALLDFRGGIYGVSWDGCLFVEVAPTDGEPLPVVDGEQPSTGQLALDIPAGPAYINRSGADCIVYLTN